MIMEYIVPIQEKEGHKNKCSSQMRENVVFCSNFMWHYKHTGYACYFSQNQAAEYGHFLTMIDISSGPPQCFLILSEEEQLPR